MVSLPFNVWSKATPPNAEQDLMSSKAVRQGADRFGVRVIGG